MPVPHDDPQALMAELAAQLGETEPEPRGEIRRIGQWLGAETALAILAATEQVEAQGAAPGG